MYFKCGQREKSRRLLTISLEARYASFPYDTFKLLLTNGNSENQLLFLSGLTSVCVNIQHSLPPADVRKTPAAPALRAPDSPNDITDISIHSDEISYHIISPKPYIKTASTITDIYYFERSIYSIFQQLRRGLL